MMMSVLLLWAACSLLSGGCAIILVALGALRVLGSLGSLGGHVLFGCPMKIKTSARDKEESYPLCLPRYSHRCHHSFVLLDKEELA